MINRASRRAAPKLANRTCGCCGAVIRLQAARADSNKARQINVLGGSDGILTWLGAVSMVRAAFEGDGA
jgi:hypothetical protein